MGVFLPALQLGVGVVDLERERGVNLESEDVGCNNQYMD